MVTVTMSMEEYDRLTKSKFEARELWSAIALISVFLKQGQSVEDIIGYLRLHKGGFATVCPETVEKVIRQLSGSEGD